MWIKEYEELIFSNDENYQEKIIRAIEIKYENMPESFYKYCKINDNTLNSLKNNNLFFSSIATFNDPFESAVSIQNDKIEKEICKKIIKLIKNKIDPNFNMSIDEISTLKDFILKIDKEERIPKDVLEESIDLTKDSIKYKIDEITTYLYTLSNINHRICCLSTVNNNIKMWSHYADDHKGFCLEYNFKELNNDLTELLLPVRYTDEVLDVSDCFTDKMNNSIILNALTRKYTEWSEEKEWRIIINSTNNAQGQCVTTPTPKKIFLGNQINVENKNKIIEIAKVKNIEIYQMKKRPVNYQLYPVRLEL